MREEEGVLPIEHGWREELVHDIAQELLKQRKLITDIGATLVAIDILVLVHKAQFKFLMEKERQQLVQVIAMLVDYIRPGSGEDTAGILMKAGAFHVTPVAELAKEVDAVTRRRSE